MDIDDSSEVWSLACNCLLYETDPGPDQLNVGTTVEPKMLPRRTAWRELYARLLVERLETDPSRLLAAMAQYRQGLADTYQPNYWAGIYETRLARGDPNAKEVLTEQGQRELREGLGVRHRLVRAGAHDGSGVWGG
jgi:hypothetical protein